MFFILGGCLDAPYIHMAPYVHMPLSMFICHLGVYTPICSPYCCASVCSQRLLHVVGVVRDPLSCGTLPLDLPIYGGASPLVATPLSCWLPCASVGFRDIGVIWAFFPSVGVWGVFPIYWGCWGASANVMSICTFLYIFVVSHVSHFYYGYDYYFCSDSGILWPVISFISDCGSFPDGVSSKLESVWSGSTTTLDAKRLWRCYWLCLCATAATSIFNASSGLCQLCYGFSPGRFLYQS